MITPPNRGRQNMLPQVKSSELRKRLVNNIEVLVDENGDTVERNVGFHMLSMGTGSGAKKAINVHSGSTSNKKRIYEAIPVPAKPEIPHLLRENHASVDRQVIKKSKNLGKLGKPKTVNVVKNSNYDNVQSLPADMNYAVQASIGSTIHQRGSIHSSRKDGGHSKDSRLYQQYKKSDYGKQALPKNSVRSPARKETAAISISNQNQNAIYSQPQSKYASLGATKPNIRGPPISSASNTLKRSQQTSYSLANPRQNMSNNKQIQYKFDKTDIEFPIVPKSMERAALPKTKGILSNKSRGQTSASREARSGGERPYSNNRMSSGSAGRKSGLKPVGAGPGQTVQRGSAFKNIQQEYYEKKDRMESRLSEEVRQHSVGKDAIKMKRVRFPMGEEDDDRRYQPDFEVGQNHEDLDLEPRRERSLNKRQLGINEKTVDYLRSSHAVQMRLEDKFKDDVNYAELDIDQLNKELTARLLELDDINVNRRELSQTLIDRIRFVRDLQAQLGTADNGEIKDIIDKDMERQFRIEKQTNLQLRERIKAEKTEKESISREIEYLLSQKDVTFVSRDGNQLNLNRVAMSIDDLVAYRKEVMVNCQRTQADLDAIHMDDTDYEPTVRILSQDLQRVEDQRSDLLDQLRDLQARYDEIFCKNETRIRSECLVFRRSKTRHSTHALTNALQRAFNRNLKMHFFYLRTTLNNDSKQISSILAFRKLCYKYNDSRLSKYFYVWYQKGLKPRQLKKVNRKVTKFMRKNDDKFVFMQRWHHLQLMTNTQKSYQQQLVASQIFNIKKLFNRQKRRAFDIWNTHLRHEKFQLNRWLNIMRNQNVNHKQKSFLRWKAHVLEQDIAARLNSKVIRYTVLQYQNALFQNWRQVTTYLKNKRQSRLIRTLNSLKKNAEKNKLVKQMTWEILKQQEIQTNDLLQLIFDELRLHKEQNKLALHTQTNLSEDSTIMSVNTATRKISDKNSHKALKKAVKLGVISPFGRLLQQYFNHWRTMTEDHKQTLFKKIKIQVIKSYQNKLRDAFDKLKTKGAKKTKKKKKMMVMSVESENTTMEAEIQQTKDHVKQAEVRSNNKGFAKYKRMIKKAYINELKLQFNKWKGKVNKENKQNATFNKIVIDKWKKRLYREAFDKFKLKTDKLKRKERLDVKTEDRVAIYKKRRLAKFFNMLSANRGHNQMVRKAIRPLLEKNYHAILKDILTRWRRMKENVNIKKIKKKQMMVEDELAEVQAFKNDNNDIVFTQEQQHKELVKSQMSLGRKVMKKTIAGWRNYQYQRAFYQWKRVTDKAENQKKQANKVIIGRLQHRLFHQAFSNWRKNIHLSNEKQRLLSTQVEEEDQVAEGEKIQASRTRIAQKKERASHRVTKLVEDQEYKKALIKNQIARSIADRKDYFIISRKEHIFQIWRNMSIKKRFYLEKLVHHITNDHRKHGFNSIRDADYNSGREGRIRKLYGLTFQRYEHNQYRKALHLWKERMFFRFKKTNDKMMTQKKNNDENYHIYKKRVQLKRTFMYSAKTNEVLLKECFIALYDHRAQNLSFKIQTDRFKEKQKNIWMRYAIQVWVLRSDQSIIFRQKKLCVMKYRLNKITMGKVFNRLKNQWRAYSTMKKKLERVFVNNHCLLTRDAYDCLLHRVHMVKMHRDEQRIEGQCQMSRMCSKLYKKNLSKWFSKFKARGEAIAHKNDAITQLMQRQISRFYRDAFEKWKTQAAMLEVVRFNNEEGLTAQQCKERQQEILNLKIMLHDKQIATPGQANKLMVKNEDKYEYLMNKSRIRWGLFGDGQDKINDDWLKAHCWDKLQRFVDLRRKYVAQTKTIGYFWGKDDTSKLGHAFFRWKKQQDSRRKYLEGLTQQELFDLAHGGQLELLDAADQLAMAQHEIDDLKNQREYLIDKVVLGQKLALARCRFSMTFALEKGWNRMILNSRGGETAAAVAGLQGAISQINDTKLRIEDVQLENEDIAEQNEGLKEGAREGEQSLEQLEHVQLEVETQNEQLIETADQIKALLAQNRQLQQALEVYEE